MYLYGVSSKVVARVIPPSFKAAAKVARGLKVEPGCLNVLVARFKVRLEDFCPRPPTMAFT